MSLLLLLRSPAGTAWDPGTQADAIGITDSPAFVLGRGVVQADPLGLVDVPLTVGVFNIDTLADAIGVTDARAHARGLTQADPAGLTDLATLESGKAASVADPVAVTDKRAVFTYGWEVGDSPPPTAIGSTAPEQSSERAFRGSFSQKSNLNNEYEEWRGFTIEHAQRYYFRFYLNIDGASAGLYRVIQLLTSGSAHVCSIRVNTTRALGIYRADGALVGSATELAEDTWHLIEFSLTQQAVGGGTVSLKINGATIVDESATSLGTTVWERFRLGMSAATGIATASFVDEFAFDTAGWLGGSTIPEVLLESGWNRPQADPLDVTDTPTSAGVYARTQADDLGVTDNAAAGLAFDRSVPDLLAVTDAQALVATFERTVPDLLGVTDLAATVATFDRTVPDLLGVTDNAALQAIYARTVADLLGVTDALALSPAIAMVDALGLTDQALTLAVLARTQDDPLGLTDLAVPTSSGGVNIADALALTDTQAFQLAFQLSDPLGLTDAQIYELGLFRTLADALGVTDLTTAETILAAVIADSLGVTDNQAFVRGYGLAQTDQLGITDQLAITAAVVRLVADLLDLADLATPSMLGAGPPTESHPPLGGVYIAVVTGGTFDESLTGGTPFGR